MSARQRLRKLRDLEKDYSAPEYDDRDYFEMTTLYLGLQNTLDNIRWFQHIREQKPLPDFLRHNKGDNNDTARKTGKKLRA